MIRTWLPLADLSWNPLNPPGAPSSGYRLGRQSAPCWNLGCALGYPGETRAPAGASAASAGVSPSSRRMTSSYAAMLMAS